MVSQKLTAGGSLVLTTTYGYAGVNRITSAAESGAGTLWALGFSYSGQHGKPTQTGDIPARLLVCGSRNAANDRWTDASTTYTYSYGSEGRRVKKAAGGVTTTVYVYDAFGRLAAEYAARVTGAMTPEFLTAAHLGSTRLVTDAGGAVRSRSEYCPFGEEIGAGFGSRTTVAGSAPDAFNPKFTGQERDAETGLDYFGARYFSAAHGRFTSPDPLLNSGRPEDPQSWNRYAYGLNNPLRFIDPTGLDPISVEDCKKDPACTLVPVNVIYDKNANIYDASGKRLAPGFQKQLDTQLAQAADEYGNAQIAFDVSFSSGTVTKLKNGFYNVTGTVAGAMNVAITDSNGVATTSTGGMAFIDASGRADVLINPYKSRTNTIAHEYAHHFTGDVQLPWYVALPYNAFADFNNDAGRALLRNWNTPAVSVMRALDPFLGLRRQALNDYARRWFGVGGR